MQLTDEKLGAAVVGAVAMLRQTFPALDGKLVWVLAFVLGGGLGFVSRDPAVPWFEAVFRGVLVAGVATGLITSGKYLVEKGGAAIGAASPAPTTIGSARVVNVDTKPAQVEGESTGAIEPSRVAITLEPKDPPA